MNYLIEETEEGQRVYKTLVVEPKKLNVFNSKLVLKILRELAKKPCCAMDIARKLKEHEQKIYYHLRRLESVGIIDLIRREERAGALAKIYSISHPYISVKIFDGEYLTEVRTKAKELEFLRPFINNGKLDAIIIVGSPDPHGKYGAQASDGSVAIDLGLFLGTFLKESYLNYRLDTEIRRADLKNNLILIGGPKANMLIDKINLKLPIYFDTRHEFNIVSTITKRVYTSDDVGILVKMENPFAKGKKILVLSGKRFKGTRAAIVALIKYIRRLGSGNKFNDGIARVVRGIDKDSDGRIDDVKFLE